MDFFVFFVNFFEFLVADELLDARLKKIEDACGNKDNSKGCYGKDIDFGSALAHLSSPFFSKEQWWKSLQKIHLNG
jgi:hypothetical protein